MYKIHERLAKQCKKTNHSPFDSFFLIIFHQIRINPFLLAFALKLNSLNKILSPL